MSHFAEIDENNTVVRVLVGDNDMPNEGYDWFVENLGGRWIKTSYNGSIRRQFAAVGMVYNENLDAFIDPKPFDSWIFNQDTYQWDPSVPYPDDGNMYQWNEDTQSWDLVNS